MALAAPVGTGSTSRSVQGHYRSVLFQLQRLGAMQERSMTPDATVPAPGTNAVAFCGSGSTVTASKSVPGLWLRQHLLNHPGRFLDQQNHLQRPEQCKSVLLLQQHQSQNLGLMQKCCGFSCTCLQRRGELQDQQLQRPGALKERCVAPAT